MAEIISVWIGEKTSEAALTDAQRAIDQILAKYQ
jgi:hypothetical protein